MLDICYSFSHNDFMSIIDFNARYKFLEKQNHEFLDMPHNKNSNSNKHEGQLESQGE